MLLNKRQPLFFIHIGKTAGVSLEHILNQHFPEKKICPYYYDLDFVDHAAEPLNYTLFYGHNWYYTLEVMPKNTQPITILRDPVKRLLSSYEHILRDRNHTHHQLINSNTQSPVDFLEHDYIKKLFSNAHTRVLGTDYDLKGMLTKVANGGISKEHAHAQLTEFRLNSQADAAMLDRAKARLREMPVFGLTEKFAESVQRIASIMNISVDSIPHKNSAPKETHSKYQQYSQQNIDALKRLNEFDIELYEFADALFQERTPA